MPLIPSPDFEAGGEAGRKFRILVADDNPVERDYLRSLFAFAGYAVLEAEDGEKALALVRSEKPDLVIADLLMPKLDGFELIRAIRGTPDVAATRIICWSATFRNEEALALGETLGVARFLHKPVVPQTLLAAVGEVLREPAVPHRIPAPALAVLDNAYRNLMRDALFRKAAELEREIEARTQLEAELRRSEQRISGIVATAMDAIIAIDHEQRIVLFNAAAEAMFGTVAAEAIGTPIERFIPARLRAAHDEHVSRFLACGATSRTMGHLQTLAGLRTNGEEFPIEASISKARIGDDVLATVVVRDISARRVAEAELRESEQRLRLAQQIGRTGTFEWNIAANEMHWSAEIAALYGLPEQGLTTTYEAWRAHVHPEDLAALERLFEDALRSGAFEGEWRVVWPDGTVHWLAGRAVIRPDEPDRPRRLLGVNIDIDDRKDAEERIRRAALHDALTGLPNRALVYEFAGRMLSTMRRGNHLAAFLFVDLDRFKPINDTYGHEAGDRMLKTVAERLASFVRGGDLVGRLGGDEFVVVLAPIASAEDAAKIAMHILDGLGQPCLTHGVELQVSPSIGISIFPRDGTATDELIKRADAAMYAVKQGGRNNFRFFEPEFNARSEESLRIETRLRKGMELDEFELYLQPIIDLATGRTVAAEALVRWPAMAVSPERFIPVAEVAGFMQALGNWILREACRLQRQWRERGLPAFPVSVNVSSIQFRQRDFPQSVAAVIAQAGMQAQDLKLEITESMLINNIDEAVEALRTIRDLGVMVALDDFGTGYSSLSYLTQLPIDIIKLDQSFVRNLGRDRNSAVVAESVIALASSLNLAVVAEGIESEEAFAFLKTRHCQQGQGFLFSRPLPAREFETWCTRHAVVV